AALAIGTLAAAAASSFAADAPAKPAAPAPVDHSTIVKATEMAKNGQLVDAERIFRQAITAIDAGSLSPAELPRTLSPLLKIYRTWERNDDALRVAERYRKYLLDTASLDDHVRQTELDDVAAQLVEIDTRLGKYEDAERILANSIKSEAARKPGDPLRRLIL